MNFNYIDDVIDQIIGLIEERIAVLDLISELSEDVSNICKDLRLSKFQLYRVRKKAIENLEAVY